MKWKDFKWFSLNYLKPNPKPKSQLLLIKKGQDSITIKDTTTKTSSSKKLLEVLIDNKRTFNDYNITFNI